jgi:hypothetical protein
MLRRGVEPDHFILAVDRDNRIHRRLNNASRSCLADPQGFLGGRCSSHPEHHDDTAGLSTVI